MNFVAFQLWGVGLPVLLPLGWWDAGFGVAAVALLSLSGWTLSRARREPDGPWCLNCDYSLKSVPLDTTCPECGEPSSERGAVKARPWATAHASWIAGSWLAALFLLRTGPVCVSTFTDTHFTRQHNWSMQIDYPLDGTMDRLIILTPGYRIQWPGPYGKRWTDDPLVEFTFRQEMPVYVSAFPRDKDRGNEPLMWISPEVGTWRLVHLDGSVETGDAPDESMLYRFLDVAGVDIARDHVPTEVAELAIALRALVDEDWETAANLQRIAIRRHTPVGSRHAIRAWWWLLFATAMGFVLHRRGLRRIRHALRVAP